MTVTSALKKILKVKSKIVNTIFIGTELQAIINAISSPVWKVYAQELISGVSFDNVVKKHSKNKGAQQIKAHVTNALKTLGGGKKIKDDYTERTSKSLIRAENLDEIRISARDWNVKKGMILSLTSFQFVMEKKINEWFKGFEVFACEMDIDIILEMYKTIAGEKLNFVKHIFAGKIGEIIRTSPESTFAHVNLDFCASLTTFAPDIETAISRKIVQVGGCIFITISQRAKGVDTEKDLVKLVRQAGGKNYDYDLYAKGYNDKQGPMYSMILRRIK